MAGQRIGFGSCGVSREGEGRIRHAGVDPARRHGIASDFRPMIHGYRTNEAVYERLRGIVEGHRGIGGMTRYRADGDDDTTRLLHARNGSLAPC